MTPHFVFFILGRLAEQSRPHPVPRNLRRWSQPSADLDRGQDVDHHEVDDHHAAGNPRPVAVHLQQHDVRHGQLGQRRSSLALHGEAGGAEILREGPLTRRITICLICSGVKFRHRGLKSIDSSTLLVSSTVIRAPMPKFNQDFPSRTSASSVYCRRRRLVV